ncbi:hypothetical protein LY78DRAFT_403805 [Colletotrichum sublineola]|nr:hypothetical protein LY78DRAFT_403805 [Colletotrichum sublineola]
MSPWDTPSSCNRTPSVFPPASRRHLYVLFPEPPSALLPPLDERCTCHLIPCIACLSHVECFINIPPSLPRAAPCLPSSSHTSRPNATASGPITSGERPLSPGYPPQRPTFASRRHQSAPAHHLLPPFTAYRSRHPLGKTLKVLGKDKVSD